MANKAKPERGIYLRNSIWHYDFVVNGKRYRGSTGETEKMKAKAKYVKLKNEAIGGKLTDGRKIRFFELVDRFFKARDPYRPSHRTNLIIAETLKAFFGDTYIDQFTREDINCYITARIKGEVVVKGKHRNPAARTTINRDLALLKTIFNFGIEENLCRVKNPVRNGAIDLAAEEAAKRLEFLTVEEVRVYLDSCSPEYYPIALCAIETGMRLHEMLDLTWAQVDFNQKTLMLNKTKSRKGRIIYMSDRLTGVLRGLKINSREPHVFISRYHRRYKDVRGAHKAALSRAGIEDKRVQEGRPPLKFHDLRHTAATLLAQQSKDLYTVSKLLGHSTIEMTMRYAHMTEDRCRAAVQGISEMINEGECHKNVTIGDFGKKDEREIAEKKALL